MSTKAAIRDWLLSDAAIANKISNRVFPGKVPQGESFPAIVLQKISRSHEYHLTGELGIGSEMIQVDVYDRGRNARWSVEYIAELIRLRMSGYRGQLNADVFCHGATIERNNEVNERPADASDEWIERESMDFQVWTTTAVPTL